MWAISSLIAIIQSSIHEILLFLNIAIRFRHRVHSSQLLEVVTEKVSHKPILFSVDSGVFMNKFCLWHERMHAPSIFRAETSLWNPGICLMLFTCYKICRMLKTCILRLYKHDFYSEKTIMGARKLLLHVFQDLFL